MDKPENEPGLIGKSYVWLDPLVGYVGSLGQRLVSYFENSVGSLLESLKARGHLWKTLPKFWQKVSCPKSSLVKEDIVLRSELGMGVMPGSPQGSSRVSGNSGRVLSFSTLSSKSSVNAESPKVISKVIVAKLRPLLAKLVSPHLVSFIPVLNEVGLPANLIQLIIHCVSSITYHVCVNGELTETFTSKNGIRQGDPLSPYLFVLCMEKFSHLIVEAVKNCNWKRVKSSKGGPYVSHMFFADDLILFAEATPRQAYIMKQCLDDFCRASGQVVNFEKSAIYCSPNISKELAYDISHICGSSLTNNLGKYLGMPLLHSRVTKTTYKNLVDKVHARLASWKSRVLFSIGRATLIQAVTSVIPVFAMQTAKLPMSICDELDKLNRNFLDSSMDTIVSDFFMDGWWDIEKLRSVLPEEWVQKIIGCPTDFGAKCGWIPHGSSRSIGAGGVIRDHLGNWIGGFAVNLGKGQILEAELWGLFFGLNLAITRRIMDIVVEMDSVNAVNLILSNDLNICHPMAGLVSSCKRLLSQIPRSILHHIYREKNDVADILATWNHDIDLWCWFLEENPTWLGPLLLDDSIGVTKTHIINYV
ncbi:unnamed protein product [Prunus armeniaca]